MSDNYGKARDTVAEAWNEDSMKGWLVKHGVIKSDAQKKKEEVRLSRVSRSLTCQAFVLSVV